MMGQDAGDRAILVASWLDLTRRVLPAMAVAHRWPIRLDHCFMRICLDAACGQPWHEVIARPAIRHASTEVLRRAVAVAERIIATPVELQAFNGRSLDARGKRYRRA